MTYQEKVKAAAEKLRSLAHDFKGKYPKSILIGALTDLLVECGLSESEAMILAVKAYQEA